MTGGELAALVTAFGSILLGGYTALRGSRVEKSTATAAMLNAETAARRSVVDDLRWNLESTQKSLNACQARVARLEEEAQVLHDRIRAHEDTIRSHEQTIGVLRSQASKPTTEGTPQ